MMTYVFVGLSFALYIGIAIWSRSASTNEFYVAGAHVHPLANGAATAADWMSAASFLSMAGIIAFEGADGARYLMGWTGGYVLLALLLAPYLRKFAKFTVPDFVGDRYYSHTARLVAVLCVIFISFTYVAGQMRGVGVVFSQLFGIGIPAGVMIGAGIVFVYAGLGGMKGITYTQVAQYCVMAFAYTIPAFYIAIALTGNLVPQLGFIGNYIQGDEPIAFLEKLNRINQELGFSRYTDGSMSTTDMFCITAALMCGTAGLPHVIVRFFTVKNVQAVRKSACWTLGFIAVIYLTAPTIGAFSRVNLINNLNGVKHSEAPEWFAQFEKTGQMKFEDKNKDGIIQYVGPLAYRTADGTLAVAESQDAKTAMQLGEHDADPNELIFGADIMVMANPYMADVPPWAIALLMAGCIAAALSTAAGLLLVLSTSISHDLMKKIVKPELTDREEVNYARLAAFVSLAVATYFGINPPSAFIAKTVAFAFGLAASSFFPTLLLGIFSKKMSREGAITGMICGIGFTLAYIIYFQFLGGTKEQHFLGISPEGIGTIGMLINFAVAFIVNLFSPPPPQEVQEMVENIHIPSGATEATTH